MASQGWASAGAALSRSTPARVAEAHGVEAVVVDDGLGLAAALASFAEQPRPLVVDALCDPGELPIGTTVELAAAVAYARSLGAELARGDGSLLDRAERVRGRLVAATTALQARVRPW